MVIHVERRNDWKGVNQCATASGSVYFVNKDWCMSNMVTSLFKYLSKEIDHVK